MKQTENFFQDCALLIISAAFAVYVSPMPYITILLCGIIMLIITTESLDDDQSSILLAVHCLLLIIYSFVSGSVFAFISLYTCRYNRYVQTLFPTLGFMAFSLHDGKTPLPNVMFFSLLLLVAATIISLVESAIIDYLSAKGQMTHAVSVTAVNEMYEKKLNQELTIKNYFADKNARLEERENISRNIHNSVGHLITAAVMTLDAADMLFDTSPDKAREKMNTANNRIRDSLDSIRRAVRMLDDNSKFICACDLISGLSSVIDSFMMDTVITIRSDFSATVGDILIPHEHAEFLTGALQELLTNGVRHGNADIFTVILTSDSGHIRLSVSDNGKSDFSPHNSNDRIQNGFGLKKLISYASKCGGSALFSNDNGFRSTITLPIHKEDQYE